MESPLTSQPESNTSRLGRIVLRLFVVGETPANRRAVQCIESFCEEELHADYDLDIVDITSRPEMAEEMNVLATPALIKVSPAPVQRICGDLSDRDRLVAELLPQRGCKERLPK